MSAGRERVRERERTESDEWWHSDKVTESQQKLLNQSTLSDNADAWTTRKIKAYEHREEQQGGVIGFCHRPTRGTALVGGLEISLVTASFATKNCPQQSAQICTLVIVGTDTFTIIWFECCVSDANWNVSEGLGNSVFSCPEFSEVQRTLCCQAKCLASLSCFAEKAHYNYCMGFVLLCPTFVA